MAMLDIHEIETSLVGQFPGTDEIVNQAVESIVGKQMSGLIGMAGIQKRMVIGQERFEAVLAIRPGPTPRMRQLHAHQ